MKEILIVDCFDSFTYNLYHYLDELNEGHCTVIRYDRFKADKLANYSHVVLSPGPGLPEEYPEILAFIRQYRSKLNILGICLGLQCIAVSSGLKLKQLGQVLHGVKSTVNVVEESVLFRDIEMSFVAGHYHSWVIDENQNVAPLKVTSKNTEGLIMTAEISAERVYGIQFHPESIMTEAGKKMLENWLRWS